MFHRYGRLDVGVWEREREGGTVLLGGVAQGVHMV